MGLMFSDLQEWQRWQNSRRRLHVAKDRLRALRPGPGPASSQPASVRPTLWQRGTDPQLLVACDSTSPTNDHSLLAPLSRDATIPAVIGHPPGLELALPAGDWERVDGPAEVLEGIVAVASIGDHLGVGAWAHQLAAEHHWRQLVVQHGLLTPYSPPPPRGARVLAWSDADADYLLAGRPDLEAEVVGSPLLAAAATTPTSHHVSRFTPPVFLGQLHGAELSRASMTRSVTAFWRRTGATYRPHPREEDKLSRLQHDLWRRMGMDVDDSGPLSALERPVVSAFSTGVLEAAARGIPSWVFHLHPPAWLEEVWDRNGMARWGTAPTAFHPTAHEDAAARLAAAFASSR